jgi:hypothetical protein
MAEMIIPGTYIDVRAEGLISAGRIATGIVGVVGTAASGPVNSPVTLSGFANARDIFGLPDDFNQPEDGSNPLTLVRALQLIYGNGASTVIAVRAAGSSKASATYAVLSDKGETVATLTAKTPGSWANDMQVVAEKAAEDCRIQGETLTDSFNKLRFGRIVDSPQNQIRVQQGVTKATKSFKVVMKRVIKREMVVPNASGRFFLGNTPVVPVPAVNHVRVLDASGANVAEYKDPNILYGAGTPPAAAEIRIATDTGEITFGTPPKASQQVEATYAVDHAAPQSGEVLITAWDGTLAFAANEAPVKANGDRLMANYVVDRSACVRVSLIYGATVERYVAPGGTFLVDQINNSSQLATAAADATNGQKLPKAGVSGFMGTGTNTAGNNGAAATANDYGTALDSISNMIVNIVHLAGQDSAAMGDTLVNHLNATADTDLERIGVIGAPGSSVNSFLGHTMASDRVVLVAPGIVYPSGPSLPPAYAAAAITGVISGAAPQTSLTNMPVNIPGLTLAFNRGQQQQLIQGNVVAIADKEGFRVIKGVTTAGEGTPFSNIPIRRIVDYAKYGVRSGANSYLGRLNNSRVRGALKATLDAFLTRMVQDEMLTAYQLEVTATRAQEIAGEVSVTMTIMPTFSIDYIRVTMVLK